MSLELYDLPFYNASGETIPPFACMQISGWKDDAHNRDYFQVVKPNGSGEQYIFNGPVAVPAASDGMGSQALGIQASYGSGTPAFGATWGPVSGAWTLSSSGSGFYVVGDTDEIGGVSVVRVAAVAQTGRIFRGRVNVTGGVLPADATFTVDDPEPIVGPVPAGGVVTYLGEPVLYEGEPVTYEDITVTNRGRTLAYGERCVIFTLRETGQNIVELSGTGSGSTVVYFELIDDKGYEDPAVLAKPVAADGTMDAGADAFYVIDDMDGEGRGLFYGLAAYDDEDSEAASWSGFRGHALLFTLDYNETGVPGYRIIAMEGPAETVVGVLEENVGATTAGEVGVNYSGAQDMAGGPFQARRPKFTGGGSDPNFVAFDDQEVGAGAKSGEKWELRWDRLAEYYVLWRKIAPNYIRIKGTVGSTVSANTASFSVGTVAVIQGDMPELSSGNLTIYNAAKIPLANTTVAEFRWNESTDHWETEPLACHQVLGQATAGVSGGSFSIDNIELVCGSDPRSDPSSSSETLSVSNPFGWDIDNNGQVLAVKKASGTWIAVQAACPA